MQQNFCDSQFTKLRSFGLTFMLANHFLMLYPQELLDEAALGTVWRAVLKVCEWTERAASALRTQRALSALSVLATVGLVLAAGYLMAYLMYVLFAGLLFRSGPSPSRRRVVYHTRLK